MQFLLYSYWRQAVVVAVELFCVYRKWKFASDFESQGDAYDGRTFAEAMLQNL